MKEKIQKSEALAAFIKRRLEESRSEWEEVKKQADMVKHYLPMERKLYGQFLVWKEISDAIKNNSYGN